MRGTHLCALGVLETSLEERHGGVGVEVDEEVGTTGKDAKGGLAGEDVGAIRHSEDLGAESVPWVTALGRVVGEIGDGVDGLAADDGGGFMEEGVEEDALESFDGLRAEVVVESDAL